MGIIAWHPLRALNAINVRALSADLLIVHVQFDTGGHDLASDLDPDPAANVTNQCRMGNRSWS